MKNYHEGYSSLLLDSGTYDTTNMGDNAVINTLRCIEDGQIIIKALGGGSFVWNATKNKKINVLTNNVEVSTLTTQNTYYEAVIGAAFIVDSNFIKFSETGTNTSTTYLPNPTRKGIFTIAGDISASNNSDILSIALYKNGTTRLQNIDVRTTTAGQPYPFSFNGINSMDDSDTFDIRITNTGADTRTATLRTLMFTITTN